MKRYFSAWAAVLAAALPTPAQPAAVPRFDPAKLAGSVPVEIVFLRDQGPLLVRLHVVRDGIPLHTCWQQYLHQWFDFLDRKGAGELDDADLKGAPTAANMRNLVSTLGTQGFFLPNPRLAPTLADFGKAAGEKVGRRDFLEYYRKNNVHPIQVAGGPAVVGAAANDVLLKALDTNGDGRLTRAELEAARDVLAAYDADDDELIALRELAPDTFPGGVRLNMGQLQPQPNSGQPLKGPSFFHVAGESSRAALAALLLAHYDKNHRLRVTRKEIGLDAAAFARLDENQNGTLDLMELAKFPQNGPAVELVILLGASDSTPPVAVAQVSGVKSEAVRGNGGAVQLALGDADIAVQNLRPAPARLNQTNFLLQQLRAADVKMRGYVELADLQTPQLVFFRDIFPTLDRDADGKLTEKEVQTYFDLQAGARDVMTSFFVQEQGRKLTDSLDVDRDGHLAPRELLNAWQRLAAHDRDGDDVAGFAAVTPRPAFVYPAHAPLWFRKMDRNGDGDVSRREFLGTPEEFRRLDRNGDTLIDADEAAALARPRS
ncbi:MAG: hypothetical protein NZO58_02480 [Gemmataceae bacterium]|nr:hypothetical protein [Gemmataceae bacterium]